MVRTKLSLIRVFLVPYLLLFFLFAVITGAGSTWLYLKARQAQSQLLLHDLLSTVFPLVERLSHAGISSMISDNSSWLHRELDSMFTKIPDLKQVRVFSISEGFSKHHGAQQKLLTEKISDRIIPQDTEFRLRSSTAVKRLFSETAFLLRIEYRFDDGNNGPVSLEFGFNRDALQETVARAMSIIVNAITLFTVSGLAALFMAFLLTLWTAHRVRTLEIELQELYRYATAAELMAGLVHDLRNPLASFRANIASLKIMPEESTEILREMDQDIVRLDEKLCSMLDLTRKRDEAPGLVNVRAMIETVCRQAEPVLVQHNLGTKIHCQIDHHVEVMKNCLTDALLNLLLNSAESGQEKGAIELTVREEKSLLIIEISDRGYGLPAQTDIFAPFVTTKSSGNGLGLSISKRIAEAHGGTLQAKKRQGGGARFILTIPQPLNSARSV